MQLGRKDNNLNVSSNPINTKKSVNYGIQFQGLKQDKAIRSLHVWKKEWLYIQCLRGKIWMFC